MDEWEPLYGAISGAWRRFLLEERKLSIPEEINAQAPVLDAWTMQLGKWRVAKAYAIPVLDITIKTGLGAFAPNYTSLLQYKRGELAPEPYSWLYLERMQTSFDIRRAMWDRLTTKRKLALACYCKAGEFCHRHLFLRMMTTYVQTQGMTVHYHGELTQ